MMKRPSPLRPASSSSDDDDEEQLEDLVVNKENIKDEEAEEEEEENEEDDESIFIVKKHAVISTPAQTPQSSSSSMGEEEEECNSKSARSDSDLPVPPPPPPSSENTTKSSPNNTTDVVKKPITSSIPISAKRVLYESADNKPVEGEVSKRRRKKEKKKGVDDDGEVGEIKSSNKLWSKADEVVILKGLLSLINKYGAAKPTSELINELHEHIKALLQTEVTNDQLYGKIRKLKQKYLKGRTINDSKLDELANKIWGTSSEKEEVDFKVREDEEEMTDEQAINGGGVNSAARVKKERKNTTRSCRLPPKANKTVVSPQQHVLSTTEQSLPLPSFFFKEIIESGKNSIAPPEGLKSFLTKEALGFIGSSKAKDLEEKWNKLQIAEAKIYLDRIDLVKEHVELVLDAFGTEE